MPYIAPHRQPIINTSFRDWPRYGWSSFSVCWIGGWSRVSGGKQTSTDHWSMFEEQLVYSRFLYDGRCSPMYERCNIHRRSIIGWSVISATPVKNVPFWFTCRTSIGEVMYGHRTIPVAVTEDYLTNKDIVAHTTDYHWSTATSPEMWLRLLWFYLHYLSGVNLLKICTPCSNSNLSSRSILIVKCYT
jgi:hypothetical protein